MRAADSLWPWLLGLVAVTLGLLWGTGLLEAADKPRLLNLATLIGMVLLAFPAVRINEQGRLIASVQGLQKGIEAARAALKDATLAEEKRAAHQKSLDQREALMADTLSELASGKGAWTRPVHVALYGGYVLLLGAAIARVLA